MKRIRLSLKPRKVTIGERDWLGNAGEVYRLIPMPVLKREIMPSDRKKLVKKLDTVFSKYIRARDYIKYNGVCPFCHTHPIEQCFHFFSRVSHATRWREDNAIGSCAGCNMTMEFSPAKFIMWFVDHYGREKLDYLDGLWHSSVKYSNYDLELMIQDFTNKFNNLPEK